VISLLRKQFNILNNQFKESGRAQMGLSKNDKELKGMSSINSVDPDEEAPDRDMTRKL